MHFKIVCLKREDCNGNLWWLLYKPRTSRNSMMEVAHQTSQFNEISQNNESQFNLNLAHSQILDFEIVSFY
jgi:hypothetical protein